MYNPTSGKGWDGMFDDQLLLMGVQTRRINCVDVFVFATVTGIPCTTLVVLLCLLFCVSVCPELLVCVCPGQLVFTGQGLVHHGLGYQAINVSDMIAGLS